MEFKRLSKFQLDSREHCILLAVFYIMITMRSCVETLLILFATCMGNVPYFNACIFSYLSVSSRFINKFTKIIYPPHRMQGTRLC